MGSYLMNKGSFSKKYVKPTLEIYGPVKLMTEAAVGSQSDGGGMMSIPPED